MPVYNSTPDNGASDRRSMTRLAGAGRPIEIATAIVFCISSVFPAVAAFVHNRESWPQWWGVLDVGLAFLLGVLALAVLGIAQGKVTKQAEEASYRAYRILTHGYSQGSSCVTWITPLRDGSFGVIV